MWKAIDTVYKGYKMRSRLEARWACFFDVAHVEWEYEREGYELGDGIRYLPDFWLPEQQLWVEIKGDDPTDEAEEKAYRLTKGMGANLALLQGGPQMPDAWELVEMGRYPYRITLYVGNIDTLGIALKSEWDEGGRFESLAEHFLPEHYEEHPEWFTGPIPKWDGRMATVLELIERDREYFKGQYGQEHPLWVRGLRIKNLLWARDDDGRGLGLVNALYGLNRWSGPALRMAYTTAQQNRFEKPHLHTIRLDDDL